MNETEKRWRQRGYVIGRSEEYCSRCGWRQRRDRDNGLDDLGLCPQCGHVTSAAMHFGGMDIEFNRVKETFTLTNRGVLSGEAYVYNADVPDTILFMLRHFPFEKWWPERR